MKAVKPTIVQEYQQKVADMNKRMSERGMQLFQEQFLNQPFRGKPGYDWLSASQRAVDFLAPKTLQATRELYFRVRNYSTCERDFKVTNEEFALLSNAQEHAGPAILERFGDEDYAKHLDESEALIAIYNEDLQAARVAIDKQIQDEFGEEQKALYEQYQSPKN